MNSAIQVSWEFWGSESLNLVQIVRDWAAGAAGAVVAAGAAGGWVAAGAAGAVVAAGAAGGWVAAGAAGGCVAAGATGACVAAGALQAVKIILRATIMLNIRVTFFDMSFLLENLDLDFAKSIDKTIKAP